MYVNISDTYSSEIEEFCKNNNYSINAGVTELTKLGLLAYEMFKKSNLTPETHITIQERERFKIVTKPYLSTELLDSKRFLTQLPITLLDKVDLFKEVNKLSNRGLALSVLLRFSIEKYNNMLEKPSIAFLKPAKNIEKTLILSDDKNLFEELKKFQESIHVKQRSSVILFLLQLAFDELEKE